MSLRIPRQRTLTSGTFHVLFDGLYPRTIPSTTQRKTEVLIREASQTPREEPGRVVHPGIRWQLRTERMQPQA